MRVGADDIPGWGFSFEAGLGEASLGEVGASLVVDGCYVGVGGWGNRSRVPEEGELMVEGFLGAAFSRGWTVLDVLVGVTLIRWVEACFLQSGLEVLVMVGLVMWGGGFRSLPGLMLLFWPVCCTCVDAAS